MMNPIHGTSNLRLQVETTPAAMPNRFPDPDGALGTWVFWVANGIQSNNSFTTDGTKYTLTLGIVNQGAMVWAQKLPDITAGKYYRPRYTVTAATAGYTLRTAVIFYNEDGTQIAGSLGPAAPTVNSGVSYGDIVQAPAGAVQATMYFQLYKGATSFPLPDAGAFVSFNRLMLAEGASSASLAAPFAFTDPITWANILGPTHSIEINRAGLEVGTLDAIVLDAALDPAVSGDLAPGKAVRLQALVSSVWEDVFVGKIDDVEATYSLDKETNQVLTSITLNATDNIAALASNVPEPLAAGYIGGADGYAGISKIPAIMEPENAGVPWKINGSRDHVPWVTAGFPTSHNEEASVLDQIAITRDGANGYAWVDRHNVLVAYDPGTIPGTVQCQFTDVPSAIAGEDHYSQLAAGFNTSEVINQVTIIWLRTPGAGDGGMPAALSEEITYGPYSDAASIRRHKARGRTFTMQGLSEDPVAIEAFARAIIAANKTPVRKVSELTLPVKNSRSLGHAAKIDLYDLVGVEFSTLIDAQYRVTSIKHQIDTDRWLTTYGFGIDGAVATPADTPSGTSSETTDGTWLTPSLTSPFTAATTPQYMRRGGIVYLRGSVTRNGASSGASTFTLPAGYRPGVNHQFTNDSLPASTTSIRLVAGTDGTVKVYDKTGSYTTAFLDTSFPADQ